tara:strand:+ start:1321 stop:1485 length:165 start_codon:yes stop_codon:yes gene_type:complete
MNFLLMLPLLALVEGGGFHSEPCPTQLRLQKDVGLVDSVTIKEETKETTPTTVH